MTALSRHLAFETRVPRSGTGIRYVRAAKYAGIAAGVLLASPVLLPWLCYGALITARELSRASI